MPESAARVRLTVALGLALALTACSSEDKKPQALPTINSPKPTSSSTPSIDPLTANTPEAAAAFVRAYYARVNEAARSGATDRVKSMTAAECPCRALTKYIDDSYKRGSLRGFVYTIKDVKTDNFRDRLALVSVLYTVGRIEELSRQGQVIGVVPAVENGRKVVTVVRTDSEWLIGNVQNLDR